MVSKSVYLQGVGKVNMNAQCDNHVSFTASHLAVSPCGKYILVSTDGARIIMFNVAGEHVPWHAMQLIFVAVCNSTMLSIYWLSLLLLQIGTRAATFSACKSRASISL